MSLAISFSYCLCKRFTTVYWFIKIIVKSSSEKTKTYVKLFDVALLVLTKSPPDFRDILKQ